MDNVYEKDYICCQYLTNDLPHPNSENYEYKSFVLFSKATLTY